MNTLDGQGSPIEGAPHTIRYDQPIAVPEDQLPLKLPPMNDFHPGDDPQGCLARAKEWRYFKQGDTWFARETNTMPQVSVKLCPCCNEAAIITFSILVLYTSQIYNMYMTG